MKKIYWTLLLFNLLGFYSFAQDYTWAWSSQIKCTDQAERQLVLPDQVLTTDDAVYLVGRFKENLVIGDTVLYDTVDEFNDEHFIAKFKKDGTFLWAKLTKMQMISTKMTTDARGNIIVAGVVPYSQMVGDAFIDSSEGKMFYLKYSPDWELFSLTQIPQSIWTDSLDYYDYLVEVVIDNSNNVSLIFSGKANSSPSIPYNTHNIFVIRYNQNNEYAWTKIFSSGTFISSLRFKADTNNNLIFGGNYRRTFGLGKDTLEEKQSFGAEIVLGKISEAGELLWMKQIGNDESDVCADIELDQDDNIYITGRLERGIVFFDEIAVEAMTSDLFFAKFTPQGRAVMAKVEVTSTGNLDVRDLTLTDGSVMISGRYYSAMEYPEGSGNDLPVPDSGASDLFLMIYSKGGVFKEAITINGNCRDQMTDIEIIDNQLFFAGRFECFIKLGDAFFNVTNSNNPLYDDYNVYLTAIDLNEYIGFAENTEAELLIYPNPTNGSFTIDLRGLDLPDEMKSSVEVTDINGRKIFYKEFTSKVYNISNLSLAIGVHPVIIRSGDKVFTKKVLFLDL